MKKRRPVPGLSYANVVATLALFVALGSGAYAAINLPKNSVGTKQLRKNAVTKVKIRKNSVNGPRVKNNSLTGADIKLSKLGTVPSARNAAAAGTANVANTANIANSLAPAEPWHEVGAPGEPPFLNSWENFTETAGFYKDRTGIVHLKGFIEEGPAHQAAFQLPPGYRPAVGRDLVLLVECAGGFCTSAGLGTVVVEGTSGEVRPAGTTFTNLNQVDFRAES